MAQVLGPTKAPAVPRRGGRRRAAESAPPTTPTSHKIIKPSTKKAPLPVEPKAGDTTKDHEEPVPGPSRRRSSRNAQKGQKLTEANLAKLDEVQESAEGEAGDVVDNLAPSAADAEANEQGDAEASQPAPYIDSSPEPDDTLPVPKKPYPSYHAVRVVKRSLAKLVKGYANMEADCTMLRKLLETSEETISEATIAARESAWVRFCIEGDMNQRIKKDRRRWDGTLSARDPRLRDAIASGAARIAGDGEVRGEVKETHWEKFLDQIRVEKEEMQQKEYADIKQRLAEIEAKEQETTARRRARRVAKGKPADATEDSDDTDSSDENEESGSEHASASDGSSSGAKRGRAEEGEEEEDRDEDRGDAKKARKD